MRMQRRSSNKSYRSTSARKGVRRFTLPELLEARTMLSAYHVTTSADGGAGSLRDAITQINLLNSPDVDTIDFAMIDGTMISLGSPLPKLTHAVSIDGLDTLSNTRVRLDGGSSVLNGLEVDAANVTIKRMSVTNFAGAGILLETVGGGVVQDNYVGLDATGVNPAGNRWGVVALSAGNLVTGNVISANTVDGVDVIGDGNTVRGNLIGTDATGLTPQGNLAVGVYVGGDGLATANADIDGNLVSGNFGNGITINNGSFVTVHGNFIGTDGAGDAGPLDMFDTPVFANFGGGIGIFGASHDNLIGGSTAGAGNVISGNGGSGVLVAAAAGALNTIRGNLIGIDVNHAADGNNGSGVDVITGKVVIAGNVVGGNFADGLYLKTTGTVVTGNFIGTDAFGNPTLGNYGHGVHVTGNNNQVGGTSAGAGNVIAFNGLSGAGSGVMVKDGTGNAIRGNSIFSNVSLGIELYAAANVSPTGFVFPLENDSAGHTGANNYQNFPVLASVTSDGTNVTVSATLSAQPNTLYTLDFFTNDVGDAQGHGQGKSYVGSSASVMTDASGHANFTATFNNVPAGQAVWSATATDAAGNTSEFALNADAVVSTPTTQGTTTDLTSSANPSVYGRSVTFTATVTGGTLVPTGTVTFFVNGVQASVVTLAAGSNTATYTTASLGTAGAMVTAVYGGDANYNGSTGALPQSVNRAGTATTIASSLPGAVAGQTITFTATVTPDAGGTYPSMPTGLVTFLDNGAAIGTGTLDASGHATLSTNALSVGPHSITAMYNSDANFSASASAPLTQNVTAAAGSISGHTYFDVTGNGLSADDRVMGGITIKLFLDKNGNGTLDAGDGAALKTVVSDNAGAYTFSNVTPGKYFVQEVTPSGYVRTAPAASTYYTDVMTSGTVIASNDFDNYQTGCCCNSLTGVKYVINGKYVYSDLRGHVHQGDTVQVQFTVLSGHTDLLSLVSYTAPGASFDANTASQQQVYQAASGVFGPGYHTLTVVVPRCYFQVDFVCGSVIDHFGPAGSNIFYSAQGRLISADNGGYVPPPAH